MKRSLWKYIVLSAFICGIASIVMLSICLLLDNTLNFPASSPLHLISGGLMRILYEISGRICGGDVAHCLDHNILLAMIFACTFLYYGFLGVIMGFIWHALRNRKMLVLWYILTFLGLSVVFTIAILLILESA